MLPPHISRLFAESKDHSSAIKALRDYVDHNKLSAQEHHQASVIEEQLGDWLRAGQSHLACITQMQGNPIGLLYAGFWLQKSGEHEAAAALYSLCQDIQADLFSFSQPASRARPTAERAKQANQLLREFLSQQHRDNFCEPNAKTILEATWMRTHDQPLKPNTHYAPSLFHIPRLKQKAFYDVLDFKWADSFLSKAPLIRNELNDYLLETGLDDLRPYLQGNQHSFTDMPKLRNSSNWSAIDLFRDGVKNQKLENNFINTFLALESAPCYGLQDQANEVFFSVLRAKQEIPPHFGQSNHSLTVHLPIIVPDNCRLVVHSDQTDWKAQDLIIFDDNFLHSAINDSDQDRIVLIFSIWHPDLTEDEKSHVQSAFELRSTWLSNRQNLAMQGFRNQLGISEVNGFQL